MPKQLNKTLKHRAGTSTKKGKQTAMVDRATYVAAIIEPVITIPQATTIFINHTAAGISLTSWVGYEVLTVIWLWYALVHKNRLIFVYNILYFIIQTVIIIGGLMYGARW